VGQMDGQTERKADKTKWTVTQKDLHMEKTCSCLTNTVIGPDKDCYFGAYWPYDFHALSLKPYVIWYVIY
jgi:hypothetical protein